MDPPRCSCGTQGISPEDLKGSKPFHNNPPEGSPQQRKVQDTITSQEEGFSSLESFHIITDSLEDFRIPSGYGRHILRLNLSRELVVDNFGIPTGSLTGPENENPFWTTDIFGNQPHTVRDLYGSGASVDIPIVSELTETFVTYTIHLDHFSSTTSYIFLGSDTLSVGPSSTIPLQMAHFTMVPCTMTIPSRNTVVTQAPIGTPLSSIPIPSLPPGYNSLNASIPIPTQVPSRVSGTYIPSGYNDDFGFVPTPSQVLFGGSYLPFMGGSGPSGSNPIGGTTHSFASGYHNHVGGKFNSGGKTQFQGQTQIGTQSSFGGQPLLGGYNPPYGHNIPRSLAQYWNLLIQGNPQLSRGNNLKLSLSYP
jgi:hypothetical protein